MITIISYISGEVKFKIYGSREEAVINKLRFDVPIRKIKRTDEGAITFCTYTKYKKKVFEVTDKYNCESEILHEKGFPVFIRKYSKRYGLMFGAVAAIALILASTLFIWEIRITGNSYVSNADILKTLEESGVAEGKIIDKNSLEKVYNSFLMSENRISRISVNFDGTVAKVEVNERKLVPEKLDRNKNTNIVAANDGVIKRIDVFDGSPAVSPGETVTKGQLLISAFSDTRSSGTIMRAARGNAWAATQHRFEICVSKKTHIKNIVSSKETTYLEILGRKFQIKLSLEDRNAKHLLISRKYRSKIANAISLPMVWYSDIRNYYADELVNVNKEQAMVAADEELEKILQCSGGIFEIIERNVEVSENESGFIFTYELSCIENISQEQTFIFE